MKCSHYCMRLHKVDSHPYENRLCSSPNTQISISSEPKAIAWQYRYRDTTTPRQPTYSTQNSSEYILNEIDDQIGVRQQGVQFVCLHVFEAFLNLLKSRRYTNKTNNKKQKRGKTNDKTFKLSSLCGCYLWLHSNSISYSPLSSCRSNRILAKYEKMENKMRKKRDSLENSFNWWC